MKQKKSFCNRQLICMLLALILMLGLTTTVVSAATYYEKPSGNTYVSISNRTNTLNYNAPHGSFNLKVYEKASGWFVDTRYTIKMYNSAGTYLWGATNQGERTYYIGGNVTKIVITTNASVGVTLYWQRM